MLQGTRILDLTRVLAGPLCSMMLGDLGADVIKVERPGHGDETRGWGPPFDDRGESAYYLSVNRNKLGVALDLDSAADRDRLLELIAGADVVLDNFLPGVLSRRGFDIAGLLAVHERLIWCTITGFGSRSARPGYDFVIQAEYGWMAITGPADGAPTRSGVALIDVMAGKDACIAVLGALAARRPLSSSERHITISLAATATAALVNVAQNALVTGRDARRWGNAHPNLVPYQLFDASDRPLVIAVGSDAQWRACAQVLALPELASDPALATNAGRLADRQRIVDAIARRLREGTAAEWLARLASAGVPAGSVRSVLEALAEVDASPLTGVPPSVPGSIRRPPPRLDEHGAIVREHGWRAFELLPPWAVGGG